MKLFIFHDDIEEILVVANDKDDAFKVVDEHYGSDAAEGLIMSRLGEYPDHQQINDQMTAAQVCERYGRSVVAHKVGGEARMVKPLVNAG